jgi:hypothetical protein
MGLLLSAAQDTVVAVLKIEFNADELAALIGQAALYKTNAPNGRYSFMIDYCVRDENGRGCVSCSVTLDEQKPERRLRLVK